jgi:hypothetical protein
VEQNFLEAAYGHARVILTCHPHNPHITEPMHERAAASATYKRPLSSIRTENRVKPQSVYKQTVVADENLTHFAARKVEMRAGVE